MKSHGFSFSRIPASAVTFIIIGGTCRLLPNNNKDGVKNYLCFNAEMNNEQLLNHLHLLGNQAVPELIIGY